MAETILTGRQSCLHQVSNSTDDQAAANYQVNKKIRATLSSSPFLFMKVEQSC